MFVCAESQYTAMGGGGDGMDYAMGADSGTYYGT